jgi:4-amino-4-deoxy-L-arabinose transferase-like glycosyltransferase
MRLLSVLLAGLTTGFVFLFLRELMPGTPWAWTIGALAVAFQPVFGFMGGAVNPENLLWSASAAMFWLLARSFRRGLTLRRGAGIAAALAVGLFAKTSMAAVVPGVALGLALLVLRSQARPRPLRTKAAALAIVVVPPIAWLLIEQHVFGRSFATSTEQYAGISHRNESIPGALDYLWQFYLPPLPFMHHGWFWGARYPHYPLWQTYFEGFVGRFGWFAFGFPTWVSQVALAVALPVIVLAGSLLVRARGIVRRRWHELASYVAIMAGVLLLVGLVGYRVRAGGDANFEQTRYLFALLPLYGALVAVAARAAGRRGPAVAAAFLVLAIANSVFGQLVTLSHYFA